MTVKHEQLTVLTAATSLLGATKDSEGGDYAPVARSVLITNTGAAVLYIGGPTVSTSTYGYALAAGASVALDLTAGDVPYGITASSTTVNVLHLGA